MSSALEDYYAALKRLERGKTVNVPKGTKISNDAVAVEAGRLKGSIKKSREKFVTLIADIESARAVQEEHHNKAANRLDKLKEERDKYRQLYEEGLARELSLLHENIDLKRTLSTKSAAKVIKI